MPTYPTLRQLQHLVALADHKTFHKAAAACHVSQPALSKSIREMEHILGGPVIDRSSRKVRFTPLGDAVLWDGREIVERMESLTFEAQRLNSPLTWPIRMGVIPTIAPYLLPGLLPKIQKLLPELPLHIREALSATLVEEVRDGALEVALMAFPYDCQGLVTMTLFEEPFCVAAPADIPLPKNRPLTMLDIEDERILLLEDGHCLRDHALDACQLQAGQESEAFRAASLTTLIQMVNQGYGITLLPQMAAGRDSLPQNLTIRPFADPAPTRKIGLAWRRGSLQEKDIAMLAVAIRDILSGKIN